MIITQNRNRASWSPIAGQTLIAHAGAARSAGSHYLRQDSDISRALYDKQLFGLSQSRGLGGTVLED